MEKGKEMGCKKKVKKLKYERKLLKQYVSEEVKRSIKFFVKEKFAKKR